MTEKTIRNPSTPGKIREYSIEYEDGTIKQIFGIGAANAWFISVNIWPSLKISAIKAIEQH